jgi:hypothetical protein
MSKCLVLLAFGCAGTSRVATAPGSPEIRPATLVWDVGIDEPGGPSPMVETILPATYRGTPVWRIVHRDLDPTAAGTRNNYDMVDVDRTTLAPIRSIMEREGFHLALSFEGDRVTIEKQDGNDHLRTEVQVKDPRPEGPGQQILLASLPLQPGYTISFPIVDRWSSDEANRVVQIDLSVAGPRQIRTRIGLSDVLEVVLTPRNGAFRLRQWVRVQSPHYAVKTEYTRGDLHLVSELTQVLDDHEGR